MANIKVDWEDLKLKGDEMVKESQNMYDILGDIKKEIVALNDTWESNSATQMISYINGVMTNAFTRYKTVVAEYGQFLNDAATQYSSTEDALTQAANNMLDFK